MRKVESCMNCGDVREIAAHGLCYACYRRKDRADDRKFAGSDKHDGLRKEQVKAFRGFARVMTGLSDLAVSKTDALAIRAVMEPYLGLIAIFLAPIGEHRNGDVSVNSEHKSDVLFTVHRAEHQVEPEQLEPIEATKSK